MTAEILLRAVLLRTGPVSLAPDDLDLAEDLELIVSEAPFGDPPGSRIFEVRDPVDPRRAAVRRVLDANAARPEPFTPAGRDRLVDELLSALEELDR